MEKNKILGKIFTYVCQVAILIVTTIALCLAFKNNYYGFVYVDGLSMNPTLKNAEFGFIDKHGYAIDNAKRFDIAVTYYPCIVAGHSDYCWIDSNGNEVKTIYQDSEHKVQLSKSAEYKIKRIVALPGEQFTLQTDSITVRKKNKDGFWGDWVKYDLPYNTYGNTEKVNTEPITLEKGEYWVIGDNWAGSTDSASLNQRIYRKNIQGILIGIEGTCKVDKTTGKVSEKSYYSVTKYFKR